MAPTKEKKVDPFSSLYSPRAPELLTPASLFEKYSRKVLDDHVPGWSGLFFVTTLGGLEPLVQEEVCIALGADATCSIVLGKVYIEIDPDSSRHPFVEVVRTLLSLRSIEGLFVVVHCGEHLCTDAAKGETQLRAHAAAVDWRRCYALWAEVAQCPTAYGEVSFRCTAKRSGEHSWTSQDAEQWCGGSVQTLTGWTPDMTQYMVEVMLYIRDSWMVTSVKLSEKKGLGRRSVVHTGKTTLRGSLAYCLLRRASPQPGDVVLDPMCGSASLPIEAALAQTQRRLPRCHVLSSDVDSCVLPMVLTNLRHSMTNSMVDMMMLDCCRLPLREGAVDVVVTDLPFGKRIGTFASVKAFYPAAFEELARVTRPGSGRAVVLTHKYRTALQAVIGRCIPLWTVSDVMRVNHGGLVCAAITLQRTAAAFQRQPELSARKTARHQRATGNPGSGPQPATPRSAGRADRGAPAEAAPASRCIIC